MLKIVSEVRFSAKKIFILNFSIILATRQRQGSHNLLKRGLSCQKRKWHITKTVQLCYSVMGNSRSLNLGDVLT
jgi:hypothetical protein